MQLKEEVQAKVEEILTSQQTTPYKFLTSATKNCIGFLLEQGQNYWQNFGAYWYGLSDVLKNYAPKEYRQYVQAVRIDEGIIYEDVKKLFDYGSDMENWVAALEYLEYRHSTQELNGEHQYIEHDDEMKEFSLLSGFVDIPTEDAQRE